MHLMRLEHVRQAAMAARNPLLVGSASLITTMQPGHLHALTLPTTGVCEHVCQRLQASEILQQECVRYRNHISPVSQV